MSCAWISLTSKSRTLSRDVQIGRNGIYRYFKYFITLPPSANLSIQKLSFQLLSSPKMSLEGKVIAISGASSGIGLEASRECLAQGAKVSICSRNPNNLAKGYADLIATYPKENILSTVVDVSDSTAVASWIENTVAHFGHLDGAVNNAGVSYLSYVLVTPTITSVGCHGFESANTSTQ